MTHEEICTYEVCKLAKEKGFPQRGIDSNKYWFKNFKGIVEEVKDNVFLYEIYPESRLARQTTQSLLQRWLRDNGFGEVEVRHWCETNRYPHHYGWEVKDNLGNLMGYSSKMFDTYELALEDALKYALKNLV